MPRFTISVRGVVAGATAYEATAVQVHDGGRVTPVRTDDGRPVELTHGTRDGAVLRMRRFLDNQYGADNYEYDVAD